VWIDLGFVTGLLLLAAIPLVLLRTQLVWRDQTAPGVAVLFAGALVGWICLRRRYSVRAAVPDTAAGPGLWSTLGVAGLLLALALVSFYLPLCQHFWGGGDEFVNFEDGTVGIWSDYWDKAGSRPLLGLASVLGLAWTPGRIDGFLWLAVGLCFANSVLLYALVQRLWPHARLLPVVAAILLTVHHGEPSRFLVLWTGNFYSMALCWLLASLWLFLDSYGRGRAGQLVLACVCLGAALLTSEGLFPLAVLGLGLLWLVRRRGANLTTWAYAWSGTIALLAVRFAAYLLTKGSNAYQLRQSSAAVHDPSVLWAHLVQQLGTVLAYFQRPSGLRAYGGYMAVAGGLVLLLLWLRREEGEGRPSYRGLLGGLGVGLVAWLLAQLPFLHMDRLARTQFFAAAGQAVVLAFALALLARPLPVRLWRLAVPAGTAVLAMLGSAAAMHSQVHADRTICFEKTVHILEQVHALAPELAPDTVVVFVLDQERSPLGVNYTLLGLTRALFGYQAVQVPFDDPLGETVTFSQSGLDIDKRDLHCPYEKLVAFALSLDGTVSLLPQLPAELLPPGVRAERYDPLACLHPGPMQPLKYLHSPHRVAPAADVVRAKDGMILGRHWSMLEAQGTACFRWAEPDATVAVNPLGQPRRSIHLDVEAGRPYATQPCVLEAVNEEDRVVATASVLGRQTAELNVPVDPQRVGLFRLRLRPHHSSDGPSPQVIPLRAFVRGPLAFYQMGPSAMHDVVWSGLTLGRNWYPL
jgi:hypothetical protein